MLDAYHIQLSGVETSTAAAFPTQSSGLAKKLRQHLIRLVHYTLTIFARVELLPSQPTRDCQVSLASGFTESLTDVFDSRHIREHVLQALIHFDLLGRPYEFAS